MAGAYIAYRNMFDDEAITIAVSHPGGENPDFPFSNLRNRQLSLVSRFSADVGQDLELVINPGGRPANFIAFMGVNSPTYIEVTTASGTVGYSAFYTEYDKISLPPQTIFVFPLDDILSIKAIYYGFTGPTEAELSRIYLSYALELDLGVDGGWSLGGRDTGSLDTSAGQQWYESKGVITRILQFSVTGMPPEVAFGWEEGNLYALQAPSVQDMMLHAGTTGEVIAVPRTSNALIIARLAVYGHLSDFPTIRHQAGPNYSTEVRVIEER